MTDHARSPSLDTRLEQLTRQRRVFVATAPTSPAETTKAPAPPADDDAYPVLTEVVEPEFVVEPTAAPDADQQAFPPAGLDRQLIEVELSAQATDMASQLQRRLAAELPKLMESALERLNDDLKSSVGQFISELIDEVVANRPQRPLALGNIPESPSALRTETSA